MTLASLRRLVAKGEGPPLELDCVLDAAEAIARSAVARQESRDQRFPPEERKVDEAPCPR